MSSNASDASSEDQTDPAFAMTAPAASPQGDADERTAYARLKSKMFGAAAEPVRMGRFVLLRRIGAGAMGVVYAAYDPELDRRVAVKLLKSEDDGTSASRERLLREAQALARVSHPNVVAIYDVGVHEAEVWLAMEFVAGRTLGAWLRERPRRWREVLAVMRPVAEGLAAAHDAGVVHRDVKPDNIMLGDDNRIRVMDFGLARGHAAETREGETLDEAGAPGRRRLEEVVTRLGQTPGTPAYMAPEQINGDPTDGRTDQFSLCVTLWEALYGERPFQGHSLVELASKIVDGARLAPPKSVRVPGWLRAVLDRGLATNVEDRFPSLPAMLAALDRGRRNARLARAALGVTLGAAAVASVAIQPHLQEQRQIAACEQEAAVIDEVWNDAQRRRMREGMLATGAGHAATTADKIVPLLDAHVAAWRQARNEACLAAEVQEVWSDDLLARARWCLDERQLELAALVDRLHEPEVEALTRAVVAISGLRHPAPCLDKGLLSRLSLPSVEHRAAAQSARVALADAMAAERSGAYEAGLGQARTVLEQARELGWPPLEAAARLEVGGLLAEEAEYEEAETMLERAYFIGAKSGAPEEAALAAQQLVKLVGDDMGRAREGERWFEHAEVARSRLPDVERLREAGNLQNLANVRHAAAAYDEAIALHERALAIQEESLGTDHPAVANTLNDLANVHRSAGSFEVAIAMHKRALELKQRVFGDDHPEVAQSLNNLANVHGSLGAYDQAAELHARALEVWEHALGPDHPDVAMSLNNLALDFRATGAYDEATKLHERAVSITERGLGLEHPRVAIMLDNLAGAHELSGAYEQAVREHERALAIRERVYGLDHPGVATSLHNLAVAHHKAGAYDKAISLHRRALAIRESRLGKDHPDVAWSLNNLAAGLESKGDYAEAVALYERALEISEQAVGDKHPDVAARLNNLANARYATGDLAEAARLHERALAIRESALGADHADVAQSLDNLAVIKQNQGFFDDAVGLEERALAIREKAWGPAHSEVARSLSNLGDIRRAMGDSEAAGELYERSLSVWEKAVGDRHPELAFPLVGIALVAIAEHRPSDALAPAERAVEIRSSASVPAHALAEARFILAQALWSSEGSRPRAVDVARQAAEALRGAGDSHRPAVSEIERWLRSHGAD